MDKTLHKVGILGDVHGEFESLKRALALFEAAGCETMLCVGDITDGGSDETVESCITLLREKNVIVVAGNHDRWALEGSSRHLEGATLHLSSESREFLSALPKTRRFSSPSGDILLCHGVGENDMAKLLPETKGYGLRALGELAPLQRDKTLAFMVCGHTHQPMVRALFGLTVINAGTLHHEHRPRCAIADFSSRQLSWFALDGEPAALEIVPIPVPR